MHCPRILVSGCFGIFCCCCCLLVFLTWTKTYLWQYIYDRAKRLKVSMEPMWETVMWSTGQNGGGPPAAGIPVCTQQGAPRPLYSKHCFWGSSQILWRLSRPATKTEHKTRQKATWARIWRTKPSFILQHKGTREAITSYVKTHFYIKVLDRLIPRDNI